MTPERCIVCGGTAAATVFRYDAPDVYERTVGVAAEDYARAWVRCVACGFHYSRYRRDPQALDRIYDEAYRDAAAPWRTRPLADTFASVVAMPFAESETKQRVSWIKARLAELDAEGRLHLNGGPAHLLDVGGANAIFAHEFRDARWQPHVVDPGAAGAGVCAGNGIAFTQARFEEARFERRFDLVSLVYVLEHVRDPHAVLTAARRQVADCGALFIEVPDAGCFETRPREDDIFNACHLWMFSRESLTHLLERHDFSVVAAHAFTALRGHEALSMLAVPQ